MKLAVLGCGKMGSALVTGVVASGIVSPADVVLSDVHVGSRQALAAALPGSREASGNLTAAREAEVVLLCVKPSDVECVLRQLAALPESRLIISIAAGVPLAKLEAACGGRHRLVRVMPNTPALVGKGAAACALGSSSTAADAAWVDRLLSATGICIQVPEKLLDAVTGLSGSGPAYVYLIIEALADGGLLMGLTKEQSLKLAAQTVLGAAQMVLETGLHPAQLRDQVTSPGGTTIAGLAKLEEHGLRAALMEAVKAATLRSRELGS
ncbi:MAG: pyrroline-5-carboxylate reductase [Verrucomicrobiales bacterium]|nr:pyrroline-5-carboxylate reductase [Verrucomicrobiales bacterium]